MVEETTLITGATGDLGSAVARRLAARGHSLILTGRNQARLEALQREVSPGAAGVLSACLDVADESAVAGLVSAGLARFGRITSLFNNAGTPGGSFPLAEHPLDDFRRTVDTNLVGAFLLLKHTLPVIAMNADGWVVNTASEAGLKSNELRGAYAASKAAVIQLSRAAALEFGRHGVRVNTLCPGPLDGNLMQVAEGGMPDPMEFRERVKSGSAVARYGTPDEVAGFVAYLLTEAPGYLTGATLAVDGCRR